jgi:hypothetical protein
MMIWNFNDSSVDLWTLTHAGDFSGHDHLAARLSSLTSLSTSPTPGTVLLLQLMMTYYRYKSMKLNTFSVLVNSVQDQS